MYLRVNFEKPSEVFQGFFIVGLDFVGNNFTGDLHFTKQVPGDHTDNCAFVVEVENHTFAISKDFNVESKIISKN